MPKQRFSAEQVAAALSETGGLVTLAAKRLQCAPQTVVNYENRYQLVRQAKDGARNVLIDLAEHRLREAVERGANWAIAFTLKTIGRHRGYTERPESAKKGRKTWSLLSTSTIGGHSLRHQRCGRMPVSIVANDIKDRG